MRFRTVFVRVRGSAMVAGVRVVGAMLVAALLAVTVILSGTLAAVLVMPEHHALRCHDRSHPLDGEGQGQQRDGNDAKESFRHLGALYANYFERGTLHRFSHSEHWAREHPVPLLSQWWCA